MPSPAPDMPTEAIERGGDDAFALAVYGHVQSFLLHDFQKARMVAGARHCRRPEFGHGLDHGERDVRLSW